MKIPSNTFARTFLTGAALLMTSFAFAEDTMVEPEIAICDFPFIPDVIEGEVYVKEAPIDEEITFEDEVVVGEEEEFTEEEELIVDENIDFSTVEICEVVEENEPILITCWTPEMLYRNEVVGEYYISQNVGGPRSEEIQATGSINESPAPQAADEVSAVTTVLQSNVSTSIHRVATPATAVTSNGRVFRR